MWRAGDRETRVSLPKLPSARFDVPWVPPRPRGRPRALRRTIVLSAESSAAQQTEVHYDALGSELSIPVEAVERDERELDIALRRCKAEELTRVLPGQVAFDDGLRVGEVLFVDDRAQAGERAGSSAHSYVA